MGSTISKIDNFESISDREQTSGIGRGVKIEIVDTEGYIVAETETEAGGFFSYLGLKPGDYTVRINDEQSENLGFQRYPMERTIKINDIIEGDFSEFNDFLFIEEDIIHERIPGVQENIYK